jgi:hypothetical protein
MEMGMKLQFMDGASEEDKILASKYWETFEGGQYLVPAESLVAEYGQSLQQLLRRINGVSRFYSDNLCRCGGRQYATSRTRANQGLMNCEACEEKRSEHAGKAKRTSQFQSASQAELQRRVHERAEALKNLSKDYLLLPPEIMLLVMVLNKTLGGKLATRSFMLRDCRLMANEQTLDHIKQLWQAGVIVDEPEKSVRNAYSLESGNLMLHWEHATFRMVPDSALGADGLQFLEQITLTCDGTLLDLWMSYATSDLLRYFSEEMVRDQLPILEGLPEQVALLLKPQLKDFSIGQLRSVIWRSVRGANRLLDMPYYNPSKAATAVVGKVRRLLEDIRKGKNDIKTYDRPDWAPLSVLGAEFETRWGITDHTPGYEIRNIILDPEGMHDLKRQLGRMKSDESFVETASTAMAFAISNGCEAELLARFAQRIRSGEEEKQAIQGAYVDTRQGMDENDDAPRQA